MLLGIFILLKAARRIRLRCTVCIRAAARFRGRLSRRQRRRLRSDRGVHLDRFGSSAAAASVHSTPRCYRHRCRGDGLLRGTRDRTLAETCAHRRRRPCGRSAVGRSVCRRAFDDNSRHPRGVTVGRSWLAPSSCCSVFTGPSVLPAGAGRSASLTGGFGWALAKALDAALHR